MERLKQVSRRPLNEVNMSTDVGVVTSEECASPTELVSRQRSHTLFVLSDAEQGREVAFRDWYQREYRRAVLEIPSVLSAHHYEQDVVDITGGRFKPLPFPYVGMYQLALNGAEESETVIDAVSRLHREQATAMQPATWLYYPACERVGQAPLKVPSTLVLAFANALPGREVEFREWYITRHIRHALSIATLVSGQCFERTQFQRPGALDAAFSMIAVYEQLGTAKAFVDSHTALPKGSLSFPSLDLGQARFAEWMYRPL